VTIWSHIKLDMETDDVFRALADPTRRASWTSCSKQDGQTLRALEARLPMTRFGVMKHLKVLEKARLVVSKAARAREAALLNTVPIRLIHDRWVSKYAERWAAALSDLKHKLEDTMQKVFEIYIKTTPRAPLAGDHRHRDAEQIYVRGGFSLRLESGLPLPGCRRRNLIAEARIWRSIRRGGWSRASTPFGTRTSSAREPRG